MTPSVNPLPKLSQDPWRTLLMCSQLLSTIGISIAVVALCGHASEKPELHQWWAETYRGMSIPTAVAILAIGGGLFIVIEFLKRSARTHFLNEHQ